MLTILVLLGGAHAADVDRFEPATSVTYGQGTVQGESPFLTAEGFGGGLFSSYAQNLVVRAFEDGREVPEVAAMLPVALYGGYTLRDDVRFELMVPTYAFVDAPLNGVAKPAFGDVRVQANVPLLVQGRTLGLSVIPRLHLPTGSQAAFTGQGFQGGLLASLAGEVEDVGVGWLVNAGFTGAQTATLDEVRMGSTLDGLVGGYWRATSGFRFGAELDLRAALVAQGSTTSNVHLFAQNALPSGIGMTVGAGTGVIGGVGTPEYRAFAAVTYGTTVQDRDRDGIADASDACPGEAEDADGFEDADGCPDLDNDGDGIGDFTDQCDGAAEDLDAFQDTDGCPDPDNDADAVLDADDACPNAPGTPATRGCPDADGDGLVDTEDRCPRARGPLAAGGCPDSDGDTIADPDDACPDQPRPKDEDAEISDGCPKLAWVSGNRIRLAEPVAFTGTGAALAPSATPVLDALAQLLTRYPQLKQVEVQVHHDDALEDGPSTTLTQKRADAVVTALVRAGVGADRLVAKGYGKTNPIDTNRTESGRTHNRRVELHILRQEALPKRPVKTPPVPVEAPPVPIASPGTDTPWGDLVDPGPPGALSVSIAGGGWATVYLDGRRLTKGAPFTDFEVPAGSHELRVSNPTIKLDYRKFIEVKSGKTLAVIVPIPGLTGPPPGGEADDAPAPWGAAPSGEVPPPKVFDGNFSLFPDEPEEDEAPAPTKAKRPPRGSKKR